MSTPHAPCKTCDDGFFCIVRSELYNAEAAEARRAADKAFENLKAEVKKFLGPLGDNDVLVEIMSTDLMSRPDLPEEEENEK